MDFLVVIKCPATGREVCTGLVTDVQTLANIPKQLVELRCPECGDTHSWNESNAFLAGSVCN